MTTEAPKEVTINCETNEITERFLTDDEIAQLEIARVKYEEELAAKEVEAERVATLKESAKTKLIAGEPLTEEEAATIVL